MIADVVLGDIVQTRKAHACGFDRWKVIRTGADIKIKCEHCGRIVMMTRDDYFACVKKRISQAPRDVEEI